MKALRLVQTIVALGLAIGVTLAGCAKTAPTSSPTSARAPEPAATSVPTPATTAASPAGPYGSLKIALTSFGNENLIPRIGGSPPPHYHMFDFLFYLDKGQATPGVVERWDIAPDGLSYVFYVRKGIKFHNGDDLTAKDVKFSIEQYKLPDALLPYTRNWVDRVEIIDDYSLRVYTKGKQPYLLFMMSPLDLANQGEVQPKDYFERNGEEYFKTRPVGSGPLKFARQVYGDMVEYEAVDRHWRLVPGFKQIAFLLVPEEATRVAMLKTGGADVAEATIENAQRLESAGFKSFVGNMRQFTAQLHGAYDPRAKGMPTADIRVRQALSLAINRDEVNKALFYGRSGALMPGYTNPSVAEIDIAYWHDYATKIYRYDPEEAKRLLKEAGYPNGFAIRLYAFAMAGGAVMPKLGEVVAGYWQKIGVKTEMALTEESWYYANRVGPGKDIVGQAVIFHSQIVLPLLALRSGYAGNKLGAVNNMLAPGLPEMDELINAGIGETDQAKRVEITNKAIKVGADTYTAVGLASQPPFWVYGAGIDISLASPVNNNLHYYGPLFQHRKK